MSFAQLLRSADARLRIDLVRPRPPRLEGATAPPSRLAPPLAAAAVACAIRMELARRDSIGSGLGLAESAPERLETLAPEMAPAAEEVLVLAREVASRTDSTSAAVEPAVLAERALQLARLEAVVRSGYVDRRIGEAEDPDDVAEVTAMVARVPWGEVGADAVAPPLFPRFADAFPDAEPDALTDGTLLVVSAGRGARVDDDDIRMLVARLVLARAEWGAAAAGERIRSIGVLLARHGTLWRAPVAPILAHEAFPALETWLLARLAKARRQAASLHADDDAPRSPQRMPKWVKKRFAPREPGTHPEGKAEKKKEKKQGAAQARPPAKPRSDPPQAPVRAKRRDARDEGDEVDERPARNKPQKPDWRRNSQWRRERGL